MKRHRTRGAETRQPTTTLPSFVVALRVIGRLSPEPSQRGRHEPAVHANPHIVIETAETTGWEFRGR
jgi:hypothetical protein